MAILLQALSAMTIVLSAAFPPHLCETMQQEAVHMCGRFTGVDIDEAEQLARIIECPTLKDIELDWPAAEQTAGTDVLVRRRASVLVEDTHGHLHVQGLIWGFLPQGHTDIVFNTRIETAHTRPLWQTSIEHRRCLVPAWAFFETHHRQLVTSVRTGKQIKQLYRFSWPDAHVMLLAGIYDADRFSIMTTKPNESVAPVHDRMPMVLRAKEARIWLFGDYASLADRGKALLKVEPVYPAHPHEEQLSLL